MSVLGCRRKAITHQPRSATRRLDGRCGINHHYTHIHLHQMKSARMWIVGIKGRGVGENRLVAKLNLGVDRSVKLPGHRDTGTACEVTGTAGHRDSGTKCEVTGTACEVTGTTGQRDTGTVWSYRDTGTACAVTGTGHRLINGDQTPPPSTPRRGSGRRRTHDGCEVYNLKTIQSISKLHHFSKIKIFLIRKINIFFENLQKIEHIFQEFPNIFDIFTIFKQSDTLSLAASGFWFGGSMGHGSEGAPAGGCRVNKLMKIFRIFYWFFIKN